MIRTIFVLILGVLITILLACGISAYHSNKPMGKSVCVLSLVVIPPLFGNIIIIAATTNWFSTVGQYIYHIGMDMIMFALIGFTYNYCRIDNRRHSTPGHAYGSMVIRSRFYKVVKRC